MRESLRSPFRKLRHFTWSKQGSKEASAEIDEGPLPSVVKCMQDAMDMRIKYEGLLTNGQIMAGAAYDFSRSLQDMASYMVESFGEVADQEIGNIFSLLAKAQFEMSKLLDLFAAHVSKTIVKPTELMMTKIQQAEIMKDEYDEERKLYILSLMKKTAKIKGGKGSLGHQQTSVDEKSVQEKANHLAFYMQSLRGGQLDNLVNQAVKYHSAHMHLFSKGFASINAVEPMIRQVALDRLVDMTLSEEDTSINDFMNSSEMNTKGKVQKHDSASDSAASSPRHLLVEQTEPTNYLSDSSGEIYSKRSAVISRSAPISPLMYHRREAKENFQESSLDNEHENVTMYALPSPLNECGGQVGDKMSTKFEKHSDLLPNQLENFSGDGLEASQVGHKLDMSVNQLSPNRELFVHMQQEDHSGTKDSLNKNLNLFANSTGDGGLYNLHVEKGRRYTQSGPLVDSPSYNKHVFSNVRRTSPTAFYEGHTPALYKSGPIGRSPYSSYTTCNISPPPTSMPYISELHKLPLPPPGSISPNHDPDAIAHSAALGKDKPADILKSAQLSPSPSSVPCVMTSSLSIPTSTMQQQDLKAGA